MGHGIAQIFAAAGHPVALHDPDATILASAPERVAAIFDLLAQDKAGLGNLRYEADFAQSRRRCRFRLRGGTGEARGQARDLQKSRRQAPKPTAILCTNTSAIPIGQVGAEVADKARVVGTHYWNPPHLVPLVEVVQAEGTSLATVEKTIALLKSVGKAPVHVRRDIPGFIGNRLQHALKREAIALVAAGVCDAETLDTVVKEGFGARMAVCGPLEQSDLVGLELDTGYPQDLDRRSRSHARPASLSCRKGREGRARHEERPRLPRLDAGAGGGFAQAAVGFPRRIGESDRGKEALSAGS